MSCLVKAAAFTTVPSFGSFRWSLLRFRIDYFYRRRRTVAKGFRLYRFYWNRRKTSSSETSGRGPRRRNVCNFSTLPFLPAHKTTGIYVHWGDGYGGSFCAQKSSVRNWRNFQVLSTLISDRCSKHSPEFLHDQARSCALHPILSTWCTELSNIR